MKFAYFYPNGKPNLKFLTFQTLGMAMIMINSYNYSMKRINDNSMAPFLHKGDIVGYYHTNYLTKPSTMRGHYVAI